MPKGKRNKVSLLRGPNRSYNGALAYLSNRNGDYLFAPHFMMQQCIILLSKNLSRATDTSTLLSASVSDGEPKTNSQLYIGTLALSRIEGQMQNPRY